MFECIVICDEMIIAELSSSRRRKPHCISRYTVYCIVCIAIHTIQCIAIHTLHFTMYRDTHHTMYRDTHYFYCIMFGKPGQCYSCGKH